MARACRATYGRLECAATLAHFCVPRADRAQAWFERLLRHTKGRFARAPFILTDWQREEIVRPLFGTVHYDDQLEMWVRRYRLGFIEVARKNGKSELLAGIGLYLLCGDDEEGAEVYGAACDRDQASLVYGVAKRMVELSPTLSKRLTIIDSRKRILDTKTASFYQVIAADAAGNLGQNPHGILFDEVISQPSRDLWDALKTGMGARTQPLMVAATTAGNDPLSFAKEEHDYCVRVAEDPTVDPSRFVFLRNTPDDANWQDERNWYFANPALGDFLSIQTLRDEANEAAQNLARQQAFRWARLNQWVSSVTRWIDLGTWDANAGLVVEEDLAGRTCYGGLDLASTSDFTAWVLVFPGEDETYQVLARFFLPRAALERRGQMRSVLERWEAEGFITVTDGDVTDYGVVKAQILADAKRFQVAEIAFDPHQAVVLSQQLMEEGLVMGEHRQHMQYMTGPCREFERALGERLLRHGGNPVLRWMADVVTVRQDADGQIKPDRKTSREKIDGIVALIMALGRATRGTDEVGADYVSLADLG